MCPLRGQSLESPLAVQPGVLQAWGASLTEGTPDEDVSHVVVRGELAAVVAAIDRYLAGVGYKRLGLRGQVHLLRQVDWASPFSPPPEYRCFRVLNLEPDYLSVVDELDRTDWSLARAIEENFQSWVFRGWRELNTFQWSSASGEIGVETPESELSAKSGGLLRLGYDDLGLMKLSSPHVVVGYSRGRPYPLDPRGSDQ